MHEKLLLFLFIICLFLFFEVVFAWLVFLCYKNLLKNFQNCPDSLNYYTTLLNILLFIWMSFENLWRQAFQSESRVESKKRKEKKNVWFFYAHKLSLMLSVHSQQTCWEQNINYETFRWKRCVNIPQIQIWWRHQELRITF